MKSEIRRPKSERNPKPESRSKAGTFRDDELDEIRRRLNTAIHEIVLACHHVDQDRLEEASLALMTAQGTLDDMAQSITDRHSEAA